MTVITLQFKVPEKQNVRTISDSFDFMRVVFSVFEISRKNIWFLEFQKLCPFWGSKRLLLIFFDIQWVSLHFDKNLINFFSKNVSKRLIL